MQTSVSENDLAWDLVDSTRDFLSSTERGIAYVHLGAGDYLVTLLFVLEVLVHKQIRVGTEFVGRLEAWADTYDIGPAARDLLERAIARP